MSGNVYHQVASTDSENGLDVARKNSNVELACVYESGTERSAGSTSDVHLITISGSSEIVEIPENRPRCLRSVSYVIEEELRKAAQVTKLAHHLTMKWHPVGPMRVESSEAVH
ncbi:hypothetical protein Tcan_18929 [Toxocara canis]|uniref:Uncharacterized protein n=1 Tax=Toxocara canis TaxID=6265 RepID=A0A0B2UNZ6_TOXCA|nr:hypothetical protein Tcan_18929 [Toxocara canis]